MTHRHTRRDFLRYAGLGLGASVAHTSGWGGLFRSAAMAAPIENSVLSAGAIIFVLNGGARTQCVFNGTVGVGTNPFGQISGLTVPLSQVMQGTGLDRAAVNDRLNFVSTCQHPNRTGSHENGRSVACTGYTVEEDKPGLLTLINHAFTFRDIPCVNLGSDSPITNIGSEISSTFAPVKLSSFSDVAQLVGAIESTAASPAETQRIERLRYTLEDRFLRETKYREPADIPFFQRKAAEIAAQLDNDALTITNDASLGQYLDGSAVRNAGLRNTFGVQANGGGNRDGANAMLALRLRQVGVAGVAISTSRNWDLHQDEENNLPPRASALGQAIAGLVDHMSRIKDPVVQGKTLLDTTVITLVTDFGRGNWSVSSGFNSNRGSDHRTNEDQTSNQCIPIIGGGLPGGKILGEIGSSGSPVGASPTYTTRQVLATVLDLLGLPVETYFPGTLPLTTELMT